MHTTTHNYKKKTFDYNRLGAGAHTFDVARLARRQISQDITFAVW